MIHFVLKMIQLVMVFILSHFLYPIWEFREKSEDFCEEEEVVFTSLSF